MKRIFTIFLLLLPVFCFSQVAARVDGLARGDYPAISGTTGTIITNNYAWRDALYVSALRGDDATGVRNNPNRPYNFIQTATDAAIPGDTVVVLDGTFDGIITNRQNVAYYFYTGTLVTNAYQNFYTDNTITNVTIKGFGKFDGGTIPVTLWIKSTNICTLTLEADYCTVIFGRFKTANIRVNTVVGGLNDGNLATPASTEPAYQVTPLSKSSVSWTVSYQNDNLRPIDFYNVNYTNAAQPDFSTGVKRFYGGTYINADDVPTEFYGTAVISTPDTINNVGNYIIR